MNVESRSMLPNGPKPNNCWKGGPKQGSNFVNQPGVSGYKMNDLQVIDNVNFKNELVKRQIIICLC